MSLGVDFRGCKALALCACVLLLLAGCGKDKELEYKDQSVYVIYSEALGYLDQGEYKQAAQYFDEVERQHPYSVWATKAKLMAAYSLYMANKYDDAVNDLDRFIAVHPGNRDVAYAYYLKALCFYEQIADVQRDQELTKKALDSLQDVVTRFPGSEYARDARLKIDLTRDHLAGKEMSIGRFYERRVQWLAAINRYKGVVDQYGDTSHAPEALERLTECFMTLGLVEEATKTAAVLGYNYPGSVWYKDAYTIAHGVPPNPGKELNKAEVFAAMAAEDAAAAKENAKPSKKAKRGKQVPVTAPTPAPEAAPSVPAAPEPPPPPPSEPAAALPTPAQAPAAASGANAASEIAAPPVTGPRIGVPSKGEAAKPGMATPSEQKDEKDKEKGPKPWWKLW
jgi:outer membrane protein assembly factor BamD